MIIGDSYDPVKLLALIRRAPKLHSFRKIYLHLFEEVREKSNLLASYVLDFFLFKTWTFTKGSVIKLCKNKASTDTSDLSSVQLFDLFPLVSNERKKLQTTADNLAPGVKMSEGKYIPWENHRRLAIVYIEMLKLDLDYVLSKCYME